MPSTEIKYSGNWFYGYISGTLAMSRTLFWDLFMVEKIKDAHIEAVELSTSILGRITSDKFGSKSWCIDGSKPARSDMCGSYKGSEGWGTLAYSTTYKSSKLQHWNKDDSNFVDFWFCPLSTVHTLARPKRREGEIVIQ